MTHDTPELSIVICTRNRAAQLHGTLESLIAMKTDLPWEAILMDNASTDDTVDVIRAASVREPRIRYCREDRIGLGAARDRAWREARAPLMSFTDDDCYLAEDYVDAVVAAFREHPNVGVLGGRILLFDPEDARITIDERASPVEIQPRRFVATGTFMGANLSFRREALQTIGGFDPELGAGTPFPCEDIDAAAAVLWSGFLGRYDPRPLVHHHHRRRAKDVPNAVAGYDRGRGAYYAKFLLRPECRWAYTVGWTRRIIRGLSPRGLTKFFRELRSAAAYLRQRRKTVALIALMVPGVVLYCVAAMGAVARAVVRPIVGPRARRLLPYGRSGS